MKKTILKGFVPVAVLCLLFACKKDAAVNQAAPVSDRVLQQIHELGFSNKDVAVHEDGYLVEGDIVITEKELGTKPSIQLLRIGGEEQYRTTNLVKALPRNITVSMSSKLPASYSAALDEAIGRYNAQGLRITFSRVASGGTISLVSGNGSYLASAGFPTSGGDPYNQVKVNARAIGNQPQATVASIIAHEMGHCIGFRHTDYMNRAYSCGGSPTNEGASTVGAI
ncbi:MAG TPA: M57 family metalloprotease, partial [Flavitalea sp.]|nr:M57 family metalloprotease [Flavitalea sp.]